ncbi:MAG: hemolysin family protein [Planctomycetota bacterium]|nr:hemolysin family protein [Planctomycetota bacterium]MDA1213885.1 hemolysin family protein [Planctomycetota bacterium]
MTNGLLWSAAVLSSIGFLLSWICYSLRGFSYSRLEEISTARNRKDRFSQILRRSDEALLICEILFVVSISAASMIILERISRAHVVAADTVSPVMTTIIRVVGFACFCSAVWVIGPWTLARIGGESLIFRLWPALNLLTWLLGGVLSTSRYVDTVLHRLVGLEEPKDNDAESLDEEIRTVIDEGHTEGVLESEARSMIHRVMDLGEHDVATIMTPRTDMFCIPEQTPLEEARRLFIDAAHSRVPVIGQSTDDIIGILYTKDLLKTLHECDRAQDNDDDTAVRPLLKEIVREPFYVPETTPIDKLLETMKREYIHLAIVLDEYGGVAGLVTLEDILEEIVGEIGDEYDEVDEPSQIVEIGPDVIEVDARVRIDDLNDRYDYDLPDNDDFDTLGGFVTARVGRVPTPGEKVVWNTLRFTVLEADKRKVDKLRIEVDKALAASEQDEI